MPEQDDAKVKGAFEYSYAWWDKKRPVTLPSTGLGKALKDYEKAAEQFASKCNVVTFKAAMKAFQEVSVVREKAIKKCGSTYKNTKKNVGKR